MPVIPPTPPAALGVEIVRRADGVRIALRWQPSSDGLGVSRYVVYRDGRLFWTGPPSAICKVASPPRTCWFVDKQTSAGNRYTYYVVARDAANSVSAPSPTMVACAAILEHRP